MTDSDVRTSTAYWNGEKNEFYYCAIRIVQLSLAKGITPCMGVACQYTGIGYATLYKKYSFAEVGTSQQVSLLLPCHSWTLSLCRKLALLD